MLPPPEVFLLSGKFFSDIIYLRYKVILKSLHPPTADTGILVLLRSHQISLKTET